MPVQGAGDELFSAARLAGDQHRGARLRESPDRAEDLLHRRRLAEDLGRGRVRLERCALALAFLERAPDQFDRLVDVERLGKVFVGAALEGGDRGLQIGIGGHHDDRHLRVLPLHALQQLQAGGTRHADVRHQDLRRVVLQGIERFLRRGERRVRDALSRKRLLEYPTDGAIVVDDPDWLHLGAEPCKDQASGRRMVNTVRPGRLSHSMTPRWY